MGIWKSLDYWNHSFHLHLSYLWPASWFFVCLFVFISHILSPPPAITGAGREGDGASIFWIPGIIFPLGSPHLHLETPNHWWLLHPYLLRRQKIFHFTFKKSISEKFGSSIKLASGMELTSQTLSKLSSKNAEVQYRTTHWSKEVRENSKEEALHVIDSSGE